MRKAIGGAVAALLAFNGGMTGAWASGCASPADLAALRTAALQQELMVAAFSCGDIARYNRFVRAHQPELIDSDAKLKAYFVHGDAHHGEAGYHAYKTELANASSLRSIRDTEDFCAGAADDFDAAGQPGRLAAIADLQDAPAAAAYPACPGAAPLLQPAAVQPPRRDAVDEDTNRTAVDDGHLARGHHARHEARPGAGRSERMSTELSAPAPHRTLESDAAL